MLTCKKVLIAPRRSFLSLSLRSFSVTQDPTQKPNVVSTPKETTIKYNEHLNVDNEKGKKYKTPVQSYGVFRPTEVDDINLLVSNFTSPALARALRHRETVLQHAAVLAQDKKYEELASLLLPFLKSNVIQRRRRQHELDLTLGFTRLNLVILQRYLHRMPRQVFQAAEKRASVILPLCNVRGVPSILFEQRSSNVRTYKKQVCFPGGMLDAQTDNTIVQTSLRETEEELGIPTNQIEVLGILRCNWDVVQGYTGIAVTPVVGYIGELDNIVLKPNRDEVEKYFTVPLDKLMNRDLWQPCSQYTSQMEFFGGPHRIFGLTAYLLERFLEDIVRKCSSDASDSDNRML